MARRLRDWFEANILSIAAMTLVVAAIGCATGTSALLYQVQEERSRSLAADEAAYRTCVQANRVRWGGKDYTRPLIREGWRRSGFLDLANHFPDLPAVDCRTGQEIPLPKGAQH